MNTINIFGGSHHHATWSENYVLASDLCAVIQVTHITYKTNVKHVRESPSDTRLISDSFHGRNQVRNIIDCKGDCSLPRRTKDSKQRHCL